LSSRKTRRLRGKFIGKGLRICLTKERLETTRRWVKFFRARRDEGGGWEATSLRDIWGGLNTDLRRGERETSYYSGGKPRRVTRGKKVDVDRSWNSSRVLERSSFERKKGFHNPEHQGRSRILIRRKREKLRGKHPTYEGVHRNNNGKRTLGNYFPLRKGEGREKPNKDQEEGTSPS